MLHSSGYPIAKCLLETANATTNIIFREILLHVTEAVTTEGVTPREGLTVFASYFGYNIGSILSTASVDGAYDKHFGTQANELDNDVTEELEKITEMIPTFAIGFLGITVGGVIISLYLPLFQIIAELNSGK
jgi:type IV pilus assembly protein PilC